MCPYKARQGQKYIVTIQLLIAAYALLLLSIPDIMYKPIYYNWSRAWRIAWHFRCTKIRCTARWELTDLYQWLRARKDRSKFYPKYRICNLHFWHGNWRKGVNDSTNIPRNKEGKYKADKKLEHYKAATDETNGLGYHSLGHVANEKTWNTKLYCKHTPLKAIYQSCQKIYGWTSPNAPNNIFSTSMNKIYQRTPSLANRKWKTDVTE